MQPTVNQPIPGHVQQADKDLDQQIKTLYAEGVATIRLTLKQRVRLGILLIKKKASLPHGQWVPWLKKVGIPERYAQRCIAQAKRGYAKPIDSMEIDEIEAEESAANAAAEANPTLCRISNAVSDDDVPDFGDTPPTPALPVPIQPATPQTPATPEREPGDDHDAEGEPGAPETEAEAFKRIKGEYEAMKAHRAACRAKIEPKDKNGAHFEWGAFLNAWGTLLRQIDVVGNLYGCKETPDAEGLRRQNQQYKDNFRNWVRKVSKTEPPPEPHERNRNGYHST